MGTRISFFGGPGSGKSTLAARVFAEMKMRGTDVELVTEYVKQMAYEGRKPQGYDELFIFAKQIHREELALRHVPVIVTDCPPLMCVTYARALGFPCWQSLMGVADEWDATHKSLNFFIERTVPYKPDGRFQTEEKANEVADDIRGMIHSQIDYKTIRFMGGVGTYRTLAPDGSIPTFSVLMDVIYKDLPTT